jgi:hypothetical protein
VHTPALPGCFSDFSPIRVRIYEGSGLPELGRRCLPQNAGEETER